MKAVLQYRASAGFRRQLAANRPDWLRIIVVDEAETENFAAEMIDAAVLLHVLEPVTAQVIDRAPALQLIQKIGVGVNTIDLESARKRGIAVANMPGSNSPAVAEATLLLILGALRRVVHFDAMTRAGAGWRLPPEDFDEVGELAGRTVGLLGHGAVARRLVPVLQALGADVIHWSRSSRPGTDEGAVSLDELARRADILSLHLPLEAETRGMIDANFLARLKPGTVLVNTARGGLVDESALVHALTCGRLRAAALDVFAEEPINATNPLRDMHNVILLPHISWLTPETLGRSIDVAMENCRRLRDGEQILNRVA